VCDRHIRYLQRPDYVRRSRRGRIGGNRKEKTRVGREVKMNEGRVVEENMRDSVLKQKWEVRETTKEKERETRKMRRSVRGS
jgi:hypothetical protein